MIEQVKNDAREAQKELQRVQKEHEKVKKQKGALEKEHKEAKKELHSLKLQYDPKYAFEYKQEKKQVMQRVREAKIKKQKAIRTYGRTAKN